VTGNPQPICCPAGQTCRDGTCIGSSGPCTTPNVLCNAWPSLTPGACCAANECLPVLPRTSSSGPRACCLQVGSCCAAAASGRASQFLLPGHCQQQRRACSSILWLQSTVTRRVCCHN
jgi:hypothetical protein